MDTYADMIRILRERGATHQSIAAACGVRRSTVQSWEARDSIKPEHWRAVQRCAETWRVPLSLDTLVHMAEVAAERPTKKAPERGPGQGRPAQLAPDG